MTGDPTALQREGSPGKRQLCNALTIRALL